MNKHLNENPRSNSSTMPTRYLRYVVIVADLSSYNRHDSIGRYHVVLTSAENEDKAMEQARNARAPGGGYAPLAAFSTEDLRECIDRLYAHPLQPRESFHFSTDMTDVEATADRAEISQ
jgi:hypothetical protein